jgi:prepilin-type N-terminal cleavage/methylation domain-containing protein
MFRILLTRKGFTLVEMIIVMLIFVIVIGITGDAFNRIVSKALSLTKTAESNIAGVVGLELMRVDLESAGYGVPWSFSNSISYVEATSAPGTEAILNDNDRIYATDSTQNNVPRAVMSTQIASGSDPTVVFGGSDVLVVRSQSVATNNAAKRWSYIESEVLPFTNLAPIPHQWSSDKLEATDRVVLVQPFGNLKQTNQLIVNASTGAWSAKFNNFSTIGKPPIYNDAEKKSDTYVIYGVQADSALTALRMPFNRADFYVRRPASTENGYIRLPQRCNPSTGVLFKGVVGQKASGDYYELPLLECVLDMQVVYELRLPGSPATKNSDDISTMTPKEVREQVKAVKVYVLTHDGGKDKGYTYPNTNISVGPGTNFISGSGSTYNFATNGVTDWQNYRWRVYQIVARPSNLAGNITQ